MRITGGDIRGRKLTGPKGNESHFLRPTSDLVRESLFNILGSLVRGRVVLDLFAGTGSLGLEALSRGAAQVLFVDQSSRSLALIKRNLEACFLADRASILRANLASPSGYRKILTLCHDQACFDLILLDPPYEKKLAIMALEMIDKTGILKPDGVVVVEERQNVVLPETVGRLHLRTEKKYGETGIWIYNTTPVTSDPNPIIHQTLQE